jgi:hypothetical protein
MSGLDGLDQGEKDNDLEDLFTQSQESQGESRGVLRQTWINERGVYFHPFDLATQALIQERLNCCLMKLTWLKNPKDIFWKWCFDMFNVFYTSLCVLARENPQNARN